MSDHAPWICPRCATVNAPWVDRCACLQASLRLDAPPAQVAQTSGAGAQPTGAVGANGSLRQSAPQNAPVVSSKTSRSKASTRKNHDYTYPRFEEWWSVWEPKLDKAKALPAFVAAVESGADVDAMIAGAVAYVAHRAQLGDRAPSPKYAQGWINDRRWEDVYPAAPVSRLDTEPAIGTPEWEALRDEEARRVAT